MFEGNINEGELEIGQVSGRINSIVPAAQIVDELVNGYRSLAHGMTDSRFKW
jgi:enoyl-[acyl-carrier protein] reductase II